MSKKQSTSKSIRVVRRELANAKLTIERQKAVNRRLRKHLKTNVAKAKERHTIIQQLKWQLRHPTQ